MLLDARRIDEIECIVSVMLSIVIAHSLEARNVSWAAFSGYMVMRGHIADSILRALMRVAGTGIGVMLGLLLVPHIQSNLTLTVLTIGVVGTIALYGAIAARYAYAWLFLGLTFAMFLLDHMEHPDEALSLFAYSRLIEVLAGSFACVIVSAASSITLRRYWPADRLPHARPSTVWVPDAARHALQGGVALMLLPCLETWWHIQALSQSAITIMAAMLVPLNGIAQKGFASVSRRLWHRMLGCLAGAGFAAFFLLLAQDSIPLTLLGLALGVGIGRHIENGKHAITYLGVQFTLAVLVILAPDSYPDVGVEPGIGRLIGIFIGMALLEPILLTWHLLLRPARASA